MPVERTAETLMQRVDALAAALRTAGVPPERSAHLLASAATATMNAVLLEALLEPAPRQRATPAVEPRVPAPPLALAAA